MATTESDRELIDFDSRPVRDIGDAFGQSYPIKGLRKLGIVEDDELIEDGVEASIAVYSDGSIEIDLDDDALDLEE